MEESALVRGFVTLPRAHKSASGSDDLTEGSCNTRLCCTCTCTVLVSCAWGVFVVEHGDLFSKGRRALGGWTLQVH